MSKFGGVFTDYLTLPWEQARGFIKEELEQLRATLNNQFSRLLNTNGTLTEGAFDGSGATVPSYLANTGPKQSPKWDKVDLANGIKNRIKYVSLPAATLGAQSVIAHDVTGLDYQEVYVNYLVPDLAIIDNQLVLGPTAVAPGVYGSSARVPVITVDSKGRITHADEDVILGLTDGDKGDITVSSGGSVWTVDDDTITNAKLANEAQATFKGRASGAGTGDPTDLTPNQASTILDGATDPFLRTSAASGGTGDVTGPSSSVDAEIALFNSTTGKVIKRATGTGVVHATSGVYSVANVNLSSEVTGALPTTKLGAGGIVQVVNTQVATSTTGSTQIPVDDTIPTSTEGDQYMTLAITPTSSSNKLKIDVVFFAATGTAGRWISAALFQDSNGSASAVNANFIDTLNAGTLVTFTHYMTAGTTSSTTFKVRGGPFGAATITFNGSGGTRLFGGAIASSITITEIAV